jgi:predicted nucleotidyltransferase
MTPTLADALAARLAALGSVVVAYLFGSQARGEPRSLSDVDVAVLLDNDDVDHELEVIAAVQELAGSRRADVIVLNHAPVAVAYRVLRDGVLLVSNDEKHRVRHHARVVDRYLDMEPMRRAIEAGQRHRLAEDRFGRR